MQSIRYRPFIIHFRFQRTKRIERGEMVSGTTQTRGSLSLTAKAVRVALYPQFHNPKPFRYGNTSHLGNRERT